MAYAVHPRGHTLHLCAAHMHWGHIAHLSHHSCNPLPPPPPPPPPPPHTHPFSTLQQCVAAGGGPGAGLHQQQPRQRATRPVQHLVPGAVLVLVRGPESAGGQERGTTLATTSRRQAMSSGGGPGDAAGDGVCSWLTPCMPCLALPPPPPTTPTPRGCVCAGCLLTLGWSCSWRWTPTSGSPPATAAGR
jgi:hypothetical protein